jgi:hypothetical protein
MARQAGGVDITNTIVGVTFILGADTPQFLEAFAKLIDAKATAKAVERERKACADLMFEIDLCGREGVAFKAIKARGEA